MIKKSGWREDGKLNLTIIMLSVSLVAALASIAGTWKVFPYQIEQNQKVADQASRDVKELTSTVTAIAKQMALNTEQIKLNAAAITTFTKATETLILAEERVRSIDNRLQRIEGFLIPQKAPQ